MNHIEAGVVDRVARLNPEIFAELDAFFARNSSFVDPDDPPVRPRNSVLRRLSRPHAPHRRRRLAFCFPTVSAESKETGPRRLRPCPGQALVDQKLPVVTNDFFLTDGSGSSSSPAPIRAARRPSRACSGSCTIWPRSVAGAGNRSAAVPVRSALHSFQNEKDDHNLRGKLHDDLRRLHEMLAAATPQRLHSQRSVQFDQPQGRNLPQYRRSSRGSSRSTRFASASPSSTNWRRSARPSAWRARSKPESRRTNVQGRAASTRRARLRYLGRREISADLRPVAGEAAVMKAFLMHRDRDFELERAPPAERGRSAKDLELDTLFEAMAAKDQLVYEVAKKAILTGVGNDVDTIRYRQEALKDCLEQPGGDPPDLRAGDEVFQRQRKIWRHFASTPPACSTIRSSGWKLFVDVFKRMRTLADQPPPDSGRKRFTNLFTTLGAELTTNISRSSTTTQTAEVPGRSGQRGAREGPEGRGLRPAPAALGPNWFTRATGPYSARSRELQIYLAPRDEAGAQAMSDLRDRGLGLAADALAKSAEHVVSFFDAAERTGVLRWLPQPTRAASRTPCAILVSCGDRPGAGSISCKDLYDVCLALRANNARSATTSTRTAEPDHRHWRQPGRQDDLPEKLRSCAVDDAMRHVRGGASFEPTSSTGFSLISSARRTRR